MGPATSDDAGVYLFRGAALVATVDFITPVCDDPRRFGRVAAANSLSDIYAMGGRPLFALNLCCFPAKGADRQVLAAIIEGAAGAVREAGAVILGGHTVADPELKFGLAVIGEADPEHLLTNAGARPGQKLLLTKPLGTGVIINAFKDGKLGERELEPALRGMEGSNARAAQLALEHGAGAATDITGFGLVCHALELARASGVGVRLRFASLPVYPAFYAMTRKGVSTGSTGANRDAARSSFRDAVGLDRAQEELLFDPQTSGGLLIAIGRERAGALLDALRDSGHEAALVGETAAGPPGVEVV